jgi:hypothetical protein
MGRGEISTTAIEGSSRIAIYSLLLLEEFKA